MIEARLRRQQLELTSDLRRLSAREFEQLVGEIFRLDGWDITETGRHGEADGNVDLVLRKEAERRVVQCKRWTSWDVGVDEVRKLGGTLLREGLAGKDGILITSSGFTPAAVTEAKKLGLQLIDGRELLRRLDEAQGSDSLERSGCSQRAWLCPDCSQPMVLAHSEYGWWLKCPDFGSSCRGKHHLDADSRIAVERIVSQA